MSAPSTITIPNGRNAYGAVYSTVVTNPQRLSEETSQSIDSCSKARADQICAFLALPIFIMSVVGLNTCVSNGCFDSTQANIGAAPCDSQCPTVQKIFSIAGVIICTSVVIFACWIECSRK